MVRLNCSDFSPALAGFDVTGLTALLCFGALCYAAKKSEVTPMSENKNGFLKDFAWDMVKEKLKSTLTAVGVTLG